LRARIDDQNYAVGRGVTVVESLGLTETVSVIVTTIGLVGRLGGTSGSFEIG
jgi:hypothetical protein